MSAVLIVAIATAGVVIVALAALRGSVRGFSWLASRMDSLERRMAVVESYMRPKQPAGLPLESPAPMSGGDKPA